MIIQIEKILEPTDCRAILEVLASDRVWRDGAVTAAGAARAVKNNEQAAAGDAAVKGCLAKIKAALLANAVFVAAAQPAAFSRVMINRYANGQSYGDHVDAPYIDGERTDLSFTLFLSGPDDYAGGELVVDRPGHADIIKGPQGSVVVYPSTALHRVEPVTSGARIAAFGWVRSRVRSVEARQILFELEQVLAELRGAKPDAAATVRLSNVRNNLLRWFGE